MRKLGTHLRNKLLAGALAVVPIVVLVWGVLWVEEHTKPLSQPLGFHFPGLGVLVAIIAVYLLGLIVTSLVGRWILGIVDKLLQRIPGLNYIYRAWKDVMVQPPGKAGVFHRVVLVHGLFGKGMQLGFTNGEELPGDAEHWCVFVPGVPNPISGQLLLVKRKDCLLLALPVEEAFKYLLSTGNYLPAGLDTVQANRILGS
jgi:uncharacterized membrane protein